MLFSPNGFPGFFIRIALENLLIIPSDARLGFAPAAAAPPFWIPWYYLYTEVLWFSGNTGASHAPPPPRDRVGTRGGNHLPCRAPEGALRRGALVSAIFIIRV